MRLDFSSIKLEISTGDQGIDYTPRMHASTLSKPSLMNYS